MHCYCVCFSTGHACMHTCILQEMCHQPFDSQAWSHIKACALTIFVSTDQYQIAAPCVQRGCHTSTGIHIGADLVPREVAEALLKYLLEELPTVAFKCSTQKQASNLGQRHLPKASSSDSALQGSECLGASTLLQLLKNYTRNSDTKTAITVGEIASRSALSLHYQVQCRH